MPITHCKEGRPVSVSRRRRKERIRTNLVEELDSVLLVVAKLVAEKRVDDNVDNRKFPASEKRGRRKTVRTILVSERDGTCEGGVWKGVEKGGEKGDALLPVILLLVLLVRTSHHHRPLRLRIELRHRLPDHALPSLRERNDLALRHHGGEEESGRLDRGRRGSGRSGSDGTAGFDGGGERVDGFCGTGSAERLEGRGFGWSGNRIGFRIGFRFGRRDEGGVGRCVGVGGFAVDLDAELLRRRTVNVEFRGRRGSR
jgi:hypothetical protein